MKNSIFKNLSDLKEKGKKAFALLIDPDKTAILNEVFWDIPALHPDFVFLGGSLLEENSISSVVVSIKEKTNAPIILFPGDLSHISANADALLFLSLISGRNPEYLIGQHVRTAPMIKKSGIEILPTGYMLVDCGMQTTASYISNTFPIPYDKPQIAVATALAGEYLGLKLLYLDGGSGAQKPISLNMIKEVAQNTALPLIVGGGIRTAHEMSAAFESGADVVVIGNIIEKKPELLPVFAKVRDGIFSGS